VLPPSVPPASDLAASLPASELPPPLPAEPPVSPAEPPEPNDPALPLDEPPLPDPPEPDAVLVLELVLVLVLEPPLPLVAEPPDPLVVPGLVESSLAHAETPPERAAVRIRTPEKSSRIFFILLLQRQARLAVRGWRRRAKAAPSTRPQGRAEGRADSLNFQSIEE